MRGRDRRAVLALAAGTAVGGFTALLASCGRSGAADDGWTGGLYNPSPIPVTINPSLLPVGDTIPTGIQLGDWELVLYLARWSDTQIALVPCWRDTVSGVITDRQRFPQRTMTSLPDKLLVETSQVSSGDTLVEFGVVLAAPNRITVTDAGHTVAARFCRWSADATVTPWWLRRAGKPMPSDIPQSDGGTSPAPEQRYPLIAAYGPDGAIIAQARLRPEAYHPRQD